jgi:hypothetical protein
MKHRFTEPTPVIHLDESVTDLRRWKRDRDYEAWLDENEIQTLTPYGQAGGHDGNRA